MAKQRGSKGGERERKPEREGSAAEHETAVDPSLLDQAALGNAVVQARMEGGEEVVASSGPDLEVVAAVAAPLVQRAIAALQLDPSDAARLERRVEILERSRLPEKDALIDQLHGDETARSTVDTLLDTHFGGHDPDTRWAVDGVLASVRDALAGQGSEAGWTDSQGTVALSDAARAGSLDSRAQALIADLAGARAPESGRSAAQDDVGRSTASLVRSLALMVLLDEEEEEEQEGEWADVELS